MKRILIAGCGYVGAPAAASLAARGCRVFGLRRSAAPLPDGVERVCADLSRVDSLVDLPTEIDAVIYAVGAGSPSEEAYRAAYIDGPSNLLRAMREQGERTPRVIFCSSTAVYGQERGEWVDETSPSRPRRWNGEMLLTAERLVRAGGGECAVVRLGGIYGPGRNRLIERVRSGEARVRREPHFTNRIHRDDAAGVLGHLALGDLAHDLYLGVDDTPSDEAEVLRFLAERLGVPSPPISIVSEPSARGVGSKRCRNVRIREAGYSFAYPSYREGYAAVLDGAS